MPFVRFEDLLRGFCETVMQDSHILNGGSLRTEVAGAILVEVLEHAIGLSPQMDSGPLARAVALIEARFANLLAVSGIAGEVGVSESRLYALFEYGFHTSPQRFVVQ